MGIKLDLPDDLFAVASIPLDRYQDVLSAISRSAKYVGLTRDKDEITLVVTDDEWRGMSSLFEGAMVQAPWRMIRFDTVLDFSVVGFIAEISRALADADISILSLSTFRTDAILVPAASYSKALAALNPALVTLNYTILAQH